MAASTTPPGACATGRGRPIWRCRPTPSKATPRSRSADAAHPKPPAHFDEVFPMVGLNKSEFKNPVVNWIDTRLPIFTMMQNEYGAFPTPKNFNYLWNFGALAMINLIIMMVIVVFVHIFRNMYYGSYKNPRELLWIFGVVLLLLMMATSFMGYVLPWGQMSYWGATVITNLFSALPLVGK